MAPRAYNTATRRQQQAELKAQIAQAAAALHAEKGVLATSYADIAQRAGVSLPTVYNHFPTQEELIGACTGHVAAQAPHLPADEILAARDLPAAAALFAEGMERVHVHFEPWMRWGEKRVVPALQAMLDANRKELTSLVTRLLQSHLGAGDHRETAAAWESLLSFDFWHRLVREHKLARGAARRQITQLLVAAAGQAASVPPKSRPAPRKMK